MKQKSSRFLRIDEKFYSRKNHIEQKIKNLNLAKNNINSKSVLFSETSENSNRNLAVKKNIIKKLSDRNMNFFKNKEKYYKKLILNTSLNKRNYCSKDNINDIIKNESTKIKIVININILIYLIIIKEKIKMKFISEKKNLSINKLHQLNIAIMKKKLKKIIAQMIVKNYYCIRIKHIIIKLQMK